MQRQQGKGPGKTTGEDEPWLGVDPHPTAKFPAMKVDAAAEELLRAAAAREDNSGVRPIFDDSPPTGATPQMFVFPAVICPDRATLTMIGGPETGAVFALESNETVLGRGAEANLRFDEPSVSRCHARITCGGPGSYFLEDLGSTNGTYVGGRPVRRSALRSGDRVQLGRECVFRFAIVDETEESFQRRLYESSMRDSLTSVGNRRCLFERLVSELTHARREKQSLSLLVLDVDRFKLLNDTFGHLAGDQALRAIGMRGSQVVRAGDLFARYGGEEFAVIARDADHEEAVALAERMRRAIAELRVEVGSGAISFTVSIGVVSLSECESGADGLALFARADARLYAAKLAGRDRVCSTDEVPHSGMRGGRASRPE
jgi:two-component system cell cycle response regulator